MLTFLDFFAGVGGFRMGMELAGHKCIGFCEWDPFPVMSYKSMHLITEVQRKYLMSLPFKERQKEIKKEEYFNGEWYSNDVRAVDANSMPRADVWCFGFPCQDISIAGKQLGFNGNRSSLFFTVTRIIRDTREEDRPTTLFIENVKNLLSVNGGIDFLKLLIELDEIGYDAEWQVLNSKDFGVPQNRERVFIIGHLRGRSRREVFPIGGTDRKTDLPAKINSQIPIKLNAKDGVKEEGISLSHCLMARDYKGIGNQDMTAVMTRNYKQSNQIAIPVLTPDRIEKRQNGRRFKDDGEDMFTLTAQDRHGVMVREATKQGYAIAEPGDSINIEQPNSATRRGRAGKGVAQTLTTGCNQGVIKLFDIPKEIINDNERQRRVYSEEGMSPSLLGRQDSPKIMQIGNINPSGNGQSGNVYDAKGLSPTLDTCQGGNRMPKIVEKLRIRKLTPKECFRLQGWEDTYYESAAMVNSDSQLYKQAGNQVTVNVIQAIAERL